MLDRRADIGLRLTCKLELRKIPLPRRMRGSFDLEASAMDLTPTAPIQCTSPTTHVMVRRHVSHTRSLKSSFCATLQNGRRGHSSRLQHI